MKKLIVLLLMILPLGAIAQEVKIAFVKTQEVFMAMPEVSGMEKQMADLNEKYRVELKQMQDEYQKKYSDFVAQQDSLTENIKLRRIFCPFMPNCIISTKRTRHAFLKET